MEKEIWRDVKEFEGLYQVSNFGRVKSLDRYVNGRIKGQKNFTKGKTLIPVNGYGRIKKYLSVNLSKNGKQKQCSVHRLVAIAFIPIPEHLKHIPLEQLQVNHKDENPSNNCVSNLEWCDCKYNCNYGNRKTRVSEAMKGENNHNYGKHLSEATKHKISEALKGRTFSDESKRKMSEARKGKPSGRSWMKGKHHTEESKNKMSEVAKGRKNSFYGKHHSEESKCKIRKALTNGKCSKRVLQLNKDTGEVIKEWPSMGEVERQLGFAQTSISQCCNKKPHFNTAYGYKWQYA